MQYLFLWVWLTSPNTVISSSGHFLFFLYLFIFVFTTVYIYVHTCAIAHTCGGQRTTWQELVLFQHAWPRGSSSDHVYQQALRLSGPAVSFFFTAKSNSIVYVHTFLSVHPWWTPRLVPHLGSHETEICRRVRGTLVFFSCTAPSDTKGTFSFLRSLYAGLHGNQCSLHFHLLAGTWCD